MKVNLTYYKPSGKYYSEGSYETNQKHLFEIWDEVRAMGRLGQLPGITTDRNYFTISVDVPEHEHNHPHLVIPFYKEHVRCVERHNK